jgi:hypothetical protein
VYGEQCSQLLPARMEPAPKKRIELKIVGLVPKEWWDQIERRSISGTVRLYDESTGSEVSEGR